MDIIQILEEMEFDCKCGAKGIYKSFVLKESIPYKFITSVICNSCGSRGINESDYIKLNYGVEIECDFTKEDGMGRMAYINTNAEAYIYEIEANGNENEIFSFNADCGNVECIENILMRETLLAGNREKFKNVIQKLDALVKSRRFKLKIIDRTGYSKVCPIGIEYSQIQEMDFDELNRINSNVIHEKYTPEKEDE